ncbi:hypothetical protein ONA00_02205 [Mycoplasmopsis cynos]|uniref:hypothetical protein n=1 Tax=Mycoplasmopsis cynos TaxID=171284 RepID=UPI0024C7728D|nr:hypothetical protein [Mycoplasmopsis cynos]WAM11275.1 hypothetical protein ONA00_02205 [Mycoplasmopsis cynos]
MIKTGKDRRKTTLNLIQIAIALLFLRLEMLALYEVIIAKIKPVIVPPKNCF